MENYQIQYKLGSGNFAKVYLAKHITTKQEVALKLISKSALKNSKAFERVQTEIANMKELSGHESIVTMHECFETKEHFGIAMEYAPEGELFDFVQKQEGMKEEAAREIFRGILNGVQHCHSKGIAHRDLKLENILLDREHNPKIADFGFSKTISSYPIYASSVGSLLYSSPEVVQGRPYQGPECDVWSLGVILYTMLTASMPFDDSNMGQFLIKTENGDYPTPFGVSNAVRELISKMLNPNPKTRYTLEDIFAHPWMTGLSSKQQKSKRRYGVCYKSSENIRNTLLAMNECDCSCHRVDLLKHGRDSVITKHCVDCDEFQANDPEIMMRRQVRLSRNSSVSSGYGSEFGSQMCLPTQSPDEPSTMNLLGFEFSPILRHRSSLPRKSSASTVNTCTLPKSNHKRCSVPTILREVSVDDDDIVFV